MLTSLLACSFVLLANSDFWINVLLTILGYLPGIIHALYIIFKY